MEQPFIESKDSIGSREKAAQKVQKLWRSYTNRKIYKYYRDIILFRCKGNPAKLLRGINPLQAQLLQTAVDCHVRFRLGGQTFPPNIYYKIFAKQGICDLNSFAPRDYSALPRQAGQTMTMSQYQKNRARYEKQGWYLRSDNNGWRPISHKMFVKVDPVELTSAARPHYYHHSKPIRDEKYYKKQRLAKMKWLKHLYLTKGQTAQIAPLQETLHQEKIPSQELDSLDSQEVTDLVDWAENVDFDHYVQDWYQLSTSQSTAKFVPKFINAQQEEEL